jgi:hypothetical protein
MIGTGTVEDGEVTRERFNKTMTWDVVVSRKDSGDAEAPR